MSALRGCRLLEVNQWMTGRLFVLVIYFNVTKNQHDLYLL